MQANSAGQMAELEADSGSEQESEQDHLVVICPLILSAQVFEQMFIVCKPLLYPVILGLNFSQGFYSRYILDQCRPTIFTSRPQTTDLF